MDILTSKNFNNRDSAPSKKRRKRISLTCTSCKQRKVKCDQGKPCSSCIRKKIPPHLCIYEDSPFIPTTSESTNPAETIVLLKDENSKLKEELEELRKWKEIVSGDPLPSSSASKVNLYENVDMKSNKTVYFGPTCWRTLLDKEDAYSELIKSAKNYVSNVKKEWKQEKNLNELPFEEYRDVNVGTPDDLLKNLQNYLPDYDTIKNYLTLYVEGYWNRKVPIIETEKLFADFHAIFNREGQSFRFLIRNKSIDYAKIALVLVCIKYVIVAKNSYHQIEDQYDKTDHLLRYAEKLLEYSKYMVKGTVPSLQTLIIMRQTRMINPLEGDGGDSSEGALIFKSALSMAILMGLNRNIDRLYSRYSLFTRDCLKNIWKELMFQDAVMSFHLGIPLSIDDQYIDQSHLSKEGFFGVLLGSLRDSIKILTRSKGCEQHEIVSIIERLETYNDCELLKLSYAVKQVNDASTLITDYDKMLDIEHKVFAIYVLHVLYDVLYHGVSTDDPNRDVYYIGTMKFGSLSATHLIEAILRLNKLCVDNLEKPRELFHIVEISHSIVGISKIIFIKIFCAICTFEVVRLFEDDLNLTKPQHLYFSMDVTEFELLNPRDTNHYISKSFKSPAFLHGLMTLACKYMLKIKNESFESVFNFNFCLFVVLALFKYFEKFIDRKLKDEKKTSKLDQIQTTVLYAECPPPPTNMDEDSTGSLTGATSTSSGSVFTPGSITSSMPDSKATPASIPDYSIPTGAYISSDVTGLNDPIDELFKDVFKDDSLFNTQLDTNFNWDLEDFLSGSGMFYEGKNRSNNNGM